MHRLPSVDKKLKPTLQLLETIIQGSKFQTSKKFVLHKDMDFSFLDDLRFPGIYMVEIKVHEMSSWDAWLLDFKKKWAAKKFVKSFVPNLKKKRMSAHSKTVKWVPLYIGKADNICSRVKGHLTLKLEKPTTGLKLLARKNLYNETFRVRALNIPAVHYDIIVPLFEKHYRNKLNPILGRQ